MLILTEENDDLPLKEEEEKKVEIKKHDKRLKDEMLAPLETMQLLCKVLVKASTSTADIKV